MPEPYIGEIQAFGFNFGQYGFNNGSWLPCDGRKMPIQQYAALFSLIGTLYGGDGKTYFNLPNLNGGQADPTPRISIGQGNGPGLTPRTVGESFGTTGETITQQSMPAHSHPVQMGKANVSGATSGPGAPGANMMLDPGFNGFVAGPKDTQFALNTVTVTGGGQPHENRQPTVSLYYCICIDGEFPSFG